MLANWHAYPVQHLQQLPLLGPLRLQLLPIAPHGDQIEHFIPGLRWGLVRQNVSKDSGAHTAVITAFCSALWTSRTCMCVTLGLHGEGGAQTWL